jgi:hypothetical protein
MRTPVTDPDEIRRLNAVLLEALTLLEKQMFKRKNKSERMTADSFKFRLNALIEEAERAHIGKPAVLSVLQNAIENMRYVAAVTAPSQFEYAMPAELRRAQKPAPRTLREILSGK